MKIEMLLITVIIDDYEFSIILPENEARAIKILLVELSIPHISQVRSTDVYH